MEIPGSVQRTISTLASKCRRMIFDPRFEKPSFDVAGEVYRCPCCDRFLFRGRLQDGSELEIKCPKCKNMNRLKKI